MPAPTLRPALERHWRAHRAALLFRHASRAASAIAVVIVLAVAFGVAVPLGPSGAWVRWVAVVALIVAAAFVTARRVLRESPRFDGWLEGVELRFRDIRSWLRNALELERRPDPHASGELATALARETARRLEHVPLDSIRPRIEPRRPLLASGGALAVLVALALILPLRTQRSWATLLDPGAAAPPVRLEVAPGDARVSPGAALAVRARVWGTADRPRIARDGGPAVTAATEGVDAEGARVWRFDLVQLTRAQTYTVRAGSAVSPRYAISLAGEPAPVSFEVEIRSPGYARLPVQRGSSTRGDLSALAGAQAVIEVTFDRDLERLSATLPGGDASAWTAVTPRRWRGTVPIRREGEYELHAVAKGGEGRFRYRVSPLADAPPVIAVRTPGGDLDLPSGQQVPIEVLGQDDLGLTELRLQYRKDPDAEWTNVPLANFPARPREARIEHRWDASSLALLPGERATFRFELFDDNAVGGRGRAVSPTFELRFPSLAELYDDVEERQEGVEKSLEKASERAEELQKTLDRMSRESQQRTSPQAGRAFERSEEIKGTLERQEEIAKQLDEAARQLRESLEDAAERRAFSEDLERKLKEMAELLEEIQSPEFREALKRMREALEEMDRRAMEQQIPELQRENEQTLENLERTIALLKALREEERLESLAQRVEELKAQQEALNREMESREGQSPESKPESSKGEQSKGEQSKSEQSEGQESQPSLEQNQSKAAEETEALAREARETAEQMQSEPEKESLEKAAEELEQQAAPEQRDASESMKQNQKSKARSSGQRASESLSRAANNLREMLEQRQQEGEGADLAAIRRAAQDLVSLQREGDANLRTSTTSGERADRQTSLSEGVGRVADSLGILARRTPFISPELATALGRAMTGLQASGREFGAGSRLRGEDLGRAAGESLNEAVLELRATEGAMCNAEGQSRPGSRGRTSQQMDQLSARQGKLNAQSRRLTDQLSEQMRMSTGDRERMRELAEEQQRIREQIDELEGQRGEEEILGRLDAMKREMEEVEEMLRDGSGPNGAELEQKQQRILSRMLDATRSMNRRDFDPQRESRAGEEIVRGSAPELAPELLRENDRLRSDLLKSEADRYPAQYRAFIEAYLRSLNEARR